MVNGVAQEQPPHVAAGSFHDDVVPHQKLPGLCVPRRVIERLEFGFDVLTGLLIERNAFGHIIERHLVAVMNLATLQELGQVLLMADEMSDEFPRCPCLWFGLPVWA